MTGREKLNITYRVSEYRRGLLHGEAAAFDRLEPWEQMCFAFGQPLNRIGRSQCIKLAGNPKFDAPNGWALPGADMGRQSWVERLMAFLKLVLK